MGLISGLMGNAGELPLKKLNEDLAVLLTDGETVEVGYKVIRDSFVFTNRRLILIDVQGMTGRKKEYLSIPYSKITKFSVETAGTFDLDAELKIWVGSDLDPIQKQFNKKVNIYDLQRALANHTLV